ncbi:MAG: twin-arginine translocase TatA/TatE family subunit [Acidobacteriaceae bacterium]|nr:twin-arginine translocase TatA/TatE family subunit [Acidobacteriaceae bacterium]
MRLGGPEIVVILIVFLLLFGGKKLPDLAKGLGEGIRNFKKSVSSDESEKDEEKKQA